jgi:cardiolipin synthase
VLLYLWITLGDYLDGFLARATGQYSRMGALLDPIVDRAAVLAGAAVCWHFELLPRWALVVVAVREVVTLVLARMALRRGIDLEINWVGRIGVFLVFGGIFWSMVFDWWIIRAGFVVGVAMTVVATVVYVRAARARLPHGSVQPSSSS